MSPNSERPGNNKLMIVLVAVIALALLSSTVSLVLITQFTRQGTEVATTGQDQDEVKDAAVAVEEDEVPATETPLAAAEQETAAEEEAEAADEPEVAEEPKVVTQPKTQPVAAKKPEGAGNETLEDAVEHGQKMWEKNDTSVLSEQVESIAKKPSKKPSGSIPDSPGGGEFMGF